jgi:perosamine synthetase
MNQEISTLIPIYTPYITKYTTSAINAINTGWISNHGEYIEKAKNKLKEILGTKHIILMANGTCATHCLFIALKYKYPNIKKIYVPNNCYIAAWNSVLMEYPKDMMEVMKMDLDTWNINTDEKYIESLDKESAVLIVHNLGNIVNVPKLKRIRPDLIFVEDNCEGFTGKYDGIYSGTSDSTLCSSVSFYGNKIITTGEGGAFFTNDDDLFNYISKVYSQGMSDERYIHDTFAYNYRMTNIEAAFLYDQLNDINEILIQKKAVFDGYEQLFLNLINNNKIKLFQMEPNTQCADWIFAIRIIDNKLSIKETFDFFKENHVDIRPFFYPINKHKHLSDIIFNDEISLKLNREILMIPSSPLITHEQQEYIVNVVYKFIFYLETGMKIIEINQNNKFYLKQFISDLQSDTFRYFQKRDENIIKNHILTVVLIDKNNVVFGYAHIDFDDNKYWFGICLYQQYQNMGIGNKLMRYILNHYKIKNISEIYLTVDNINTNAIRLYEKNNFQKITSNDKYITMKKTNF